MGGRSGLGREDVPYDSLLVDHKSDSSRDQSEAFLDLEGFSDESVRVAEQDER